MAHYSFLKDLEQSKVAVIAVAKYLKGKGYKVEETSKEEQINGDLKVTGKSFDSMNFVEVKYDIMSEKTGNLCFEVYNGAGKPTGILRTFANLIYYVVKENGSHRLLGFNADKLRTWIFSPENHKKSRLVSGGDGGRYKMLLVKKEDIIKVAEVNYKVRARRVNSA